jgi:membrane-associated phospholipid phosphatase
LNNILNKIARIISTILVPPSFTIIIFTLLAFTIETESSKKITLLSTSFLFGFILPILLFMYLRSKGRIADQDALIKEERNFPYFIALLFYSFGLVILILNDINIISIAFWFCYISNTILIMIINRYWKISAHVMGAAGPTAVLVYLFGAEAFLFFILVTAIGWARIQLKCHNFAQILAGAFIGFVSTYFQIIFITKYFD